jgi:hypothetical protein
LSAVCVMPRGAFSEPIAGLALGHTSTTNAYLLEEVPSFTPSSVMNLRCQFLSFELGTRVVVDEVMNRRLSFEQTVLSCLSYYCSNRSSNPAKSKIEHVLVRLAVA